LEQLIQSIPYAPGTKYLFVDEVQDNYPKYVATLDPLLQRRNGIIHINVADFMKDGRDFT
jgi:hypothetical protein